MNGINDAQRAALARQLSRPRATRRMFGEQPFESLVGRLLCADTLIHTWDLARATGQPEALDPGGVAKAADVLFNATSEGTAIVAVPDLGGASAVMVTAERSGGASAPTMKPLILAQLG